MGQNEVRVKSSCTRGKDLGLFEEMQRSLEAFGLFRSDTEITMCLDHMSVALKLQIIHRICLTWFTLRHRESVTEKYDNPRLFCDRIHFVSLSCPY